MAQLLSPICCCLLVLLIVLSTPVVGRGDPVAKSKWRLPPSFRDRTMAMLPTGDGSRFGHWRWGQGETGDDLTGHWKDTSGGLKTNEGLHVGKGCGLKSCTVPKLTKPTTSVAMARGFVGYPTKDELRDFSMVVRLRQNAASKLTGGISLAYNYMTGRFDGLGFQTESGRNAAPGVVYTSENNRRAGVQQFQRKPFYIGDYNGFQTEEELYLRRQEQGNTWIS